VSFRVFRAFDRLRWCQCAGESLPDVFKIRSEFVVPGNVFP